MTAWHATTLGGVLVALACMAHGAERSIEVLGQGSVHSMPDQAQIQVGVVSDAPTSSVALRDNSEAMSKLLALLKQRGIADKDVQTQSFTVSPRYQHTPNRPAQLIGYQVHNQVQVHVRELSDLGTLLDAVVQHGANRVHGIQFIVGDADKRLDEARRLAIADAERKAQLYANSAKLALGSVLRIEELVAQLPLPRAVSMAAARADEAVPVATGQVETEVSVRVVFEASAP